MEGAVGTPLGALFVCSSAVITGFVIAYINGWRLAWVLTLVFPCILFGGFVEVSEKKSICGKREEQRNKYTIEGDTK